MRDDAASIAAALVRLYGTKLRLLDRLLLSEADKLHYCRSGNLEKAIELIGSDADLIAGIDAADFDIAASESSLAALVGVMQRQLYATIRGDSDAGELIDVRDRVAGALERLLADRARLTALLAGASRELRESIDDLSRLGRLREFDAGDGGPGRR